MLYFTRRYDEASRQLLKTLELDDRNGPTYAFLSWTYAAHGAFADAIAASERALSLMDAPWVLASLGHAHALSGHRDAAREVLSELQARAARQYVSPYDLAVMQGAVGQHQEALASLEAAYQERSGVLVWGVLNDPRLDPLRHERAFTQLLDRLALVPGSPGP